jgi:hypothetical protein
VVNDLPGVPKAAWVPVGEFHMTTVSPMSEAATCTPLKGRISSAVAGEAHRASATAGARHAARTARTRLMLMRRNKPVNEPFNGRIYGHRMRRSQRERDRIIAPGACAQVT